MNKLHDVILAKVKEEEIYVEPSEGNYFCVFGDEEFSFKIPKKVMEKMPEHVNEWTDEELAMVVEETIPGWVLDAATSKSPYANYANDSMAICIIRSVRDFFGLS